MGYNDFKLSWRHLWSRKIYTAIILLSLTVGLVCSNLLISFLISETRTDSFHVNAKRIFQLFSSDPFGGKGNMAYIPDFVSPYLASGYPEVKSICQISDIKGAALETEAGVFHDLLILSSDSTFFSFFNFPVYKGSAHHAFGPEHIILSTKKAQALFGNTDVLNRFVTLKTPDTTRLLAVSAVIGEATENSHLVFDALVHHSMLQNSGRGGASYVLLQAEKDHSRLQEKINNDDQRPSLLGPGKVDYFLEPLQNTYFNKSNRMVYMKTRSKTFITVSAVVCGLVLFMGSFNFINLFLLSLQARKKETGIKKTLGVSIERLIRTSSAEVSLYILIALGLSFLLSYLILPQFNAILDTDMTFGYLFRPGLLLVTGVIVFILAIIVVLISTVQQWRTLAISLVKNAASSRIIFSKTLFTVQFIIAIALTICAVTIIRQMNFVAQAPLGFNRNIVQLQAPSATAAQKLQVLKQQLLQIPGISHVAVASGNPISGNAVGRYTLDDGGFYTPFLFSGDEDFVKTLKLTLLDGQMLSAGNEGKLVNEKLVRLFNMKHPVGERLPGTEFRIAGVVKDFTCVSFKEEVPPVIISLDNSAQRILIDYGDAGIDALMPQIRKAWNQVYPEHFFSFRVIQQDLLNKYKDETFFYRTVIAFSVISMAMACFGLFALSWAVVQTRMKEIGIRKVLGATFQDIIGLLSVTFIRRISLAFIIAAPLGYFLMSKWLETFVNKIPLNGWILGYAALIVLITAFATLGMQTIKAAMTKPVDELRRE